MKAIIVATVTMFFLFGVCYLIGAFANASLDISKWSESLRNLVAIVGGIICIIGGIAAGAGYEKAQEEGKL